MDKSSNPYAPGAGRRPVALAGRDPQITDWETSLTRIEHDLDTVPLVLYGLRGVGKTVLLGELARRATERGWIVVKFEAGPSSNLRSSLASRLYTALADAKGANPPARFLRALKTMVSFRATATLDASGNTVFGVDLSPVEGGGADSGDLESDLAKLVRDVAAAARAQRVGFALLIDEAQDLTKQELEAICVAAHESSQNADAVQFALAGLPSLPGALADARSYAERFEHVLVEGLGEDAAALAVREPAAKSGVVWTDDAVAYVIERTEGYPFFIQQFGQDSWNAAERSPITLHDAQVGSDLSILALDAGFFRTRWGRATEAERAYLRAMAQDGEGPSQSGIVAERLGRPASSFGPARANLIAKGIVYAPEHGRIAFTVPGMTEFISRQARV